jgi:NAD(P)-dependent dehydrogenase (short-subunit alcohol dehydrogenase family)
MDLNGKRVVVLGGTSGIGLAVAEAAARAGATPVVASSNPARVQAALAGLPQGAEGEALDLRDEGGSIVFTSGIAGARPQAGWALGASICSAMEGLTRALAVELAPLRVNLVSPGFVRTPLWSDMSEEQREAMYAAAGARLPVGRVGEADDLAEAYLFLMRQGFATGQTFIVDGGGVLV